MADFQSSRTAQEIEEVLTGAVLFNTNTELSEAQKAQARANIGATSYGEGIKIVSHFDTVEELKSMVAEPKPGDAYSVGLALPYNLYIYDSLASEWKDYGAIRSSDIKARFAQNIAVAVTDWEEDTDVFVDYSFKAQIPLGEVTGDDFPIVAFSPFDATCGNFCPIAYCFDGYVEIWAKELPTGTISVPAITFIVQENADGATGNSTKGITNACGGTPSGGVNTNQLANGAVTAKKLSTDAVTRMFAAKIGVEWDGDIAPYTQTIDVDGLPKSDRIFAMLEGSDDWETSLTEEEEFNKVAKIVAEENKLIVYADDPTAVPLNLKIMVFHGSGVGGAGDMGGSENGGGGEPGADGKDGITPHIGLNGNWFIGETDTGMPSRGENGEPGKDGKSAYELALDHGFEGTEEEWLESLRGNGGGGGVEFETDETLTLKNGVLSVNTANEVEQDNTLPITSAGVFATVGNIDILLKTI